MVNHLPTLSQVYIPLRNLSQFLASLVLSFYNWKLSFILLKSFTDLHSQKSFLQHHIYFCSNIYRTHQYIHVYIYVLIYSFEFFKLIDKRSNRRLGIQNTMMERDFPTKNGSNNGSELPLVIGIYIYVYIYIYIYP
jgi:hypothetical protein